jgi:hypothetical protein
MSYGATVADAVHQAGIYAGKILSGDKAAELPVIEVRDQPQDRQGAWLLRCRQRPGNGVSHRTAWWGWEDSHLQPVRYEPTGRIASGRESTNE